MTARIELHNVSYTYPTPGEAATPALDNITLRIEAGSYVAIVGANGSGKSTLARHLNALLIPSAGQVQVMGLDTHDAVHHPQIHRTVGMVFQRPEDQMVATTVTEDVAFGVENMGVPPAQIRTRVREALEAVGMWTDRDRPPHQLSAGQMQRVALAGVLAMQPRCIVFDEATAMLDPVGRQAVRRLMARLHGQGLTIITITHFMEEALDAERVIVLHQGHVALDASPDRIFEQPGTLHTLGLALPAITALANRMHAHFPLGHDRAILSVRALVTAIDALGTPQTNRKPTLPTFPPLTVHPLIEVRSLGHTYMRGTPLARRALSEVNLTVAPHGAHGLLGATGSGKSTLLQHLNGLLHPQTGTVRVDAFDLADPSLDLRQVRRYVGLTFQMPEQQMFERYVGDEIAYGLRLLGLKGTELRARVREAMALVGLGFDAMKDRLSFTLSGGERRKVALASILALKPEVLLLDEPTAGLDPVSRQEILGHLATWLQSGTTVLLASHQMEDHAALSQRLTVLENGSTALEGSVNAVFAQGERLRALGLGIPVVTEVSEGLRERGWPLPAGLISADALIAEMTQLLPISNHGTTTGTTKDS